MRTLLRHLLFVCLLAPSSYLSAQTVNPFDIQLKQVQSSFSSAGELQQLVLLDRIFRLADYIDHRHALLAFLDSVAADATEPQTNRREASAISAQLRGENAAGAPPRWFAQAESRRQVLSAAAQLTGPQVAEPYQLLSELEHMAGSPNATEHIEKAAQLSPTVERWRLLASFTDDPFQKFAAIQSGLTLDPDDARLNLQLAEYYVGRNEPEKARDLLTRAAAAWPGNFVLRERLAGLYLRLGLRSQALRELRDLQQQWPNPLWLCSHLAADYEQLGLRDEAAALAASVLSRQKNSPEMLQLLTRFHRSRHMPRELEGDDFSLAALQPQSPDVWRELSMLQAGSGDLKGARSSLQQLLALSPNDAAAHRRL
ncbi:MAG: tetratricopeptide repeat protein, partial [Actinomycetota bacterium]